MEIFQIFSQIFGSIFSIILWITVVSFIVKVVKKSARSLDSQTIKDVLNGEKSVEEVIKPIRITKTQPKRDNNESWGLNNSSINNIRSTERRGALREKDLYKNECEVTFKPNHKYGHYQNPEALLEAGIISKKEYREIKRQNRRN